MTEAKPHAVPEDLIALLTDVLERIPGVRPSGPTPRPVIKILESSPVLRLRIKLALTPEASTPDTSTAAASGLDAALRQHGYPDAHLEIRVIAIG